MTTRRSHYIYGLLAVVWALLILWLGAEHYRVGQAAREGLIRRARDISSTVGIVLRSQRHWGRVVSKERLESALKELVGQGDLAGVALLNANGEVVAAAGAPIQPLKNVAQTEPLWEARTVTLMNLVDLGTNVTRDLEYTNPPIVLSQSNLFRPFGTNPPPGTNVALPPRPPAAPDLEPPPPPRDEDNRDGQRPARGGHWDRRHGGPRLGRPPWMSPEEYQSLIQKQGAHSFVIVMATDTVNDLNRQDLGLRLVIGLLATVSVLFTGLSWRSLTRASDLQIRLVRASELNTHLREMNLAAAGLAHETRNPLNIIRGLAQMLSRREDAPTEIRAKAGEIVAETDRVTAQLNEFIHYSKPREVRRLPVPLGKVAGEVARALGADLEEKAIRLRLPEGPDVTIEADESMLRQALFNLLLNAVQAVERGGEIQIAVQRTGDGEAALEVRDNGPGVPTERRAEIFKPYVTSSAQGTGLGLAVVQQIVLAHGWEVACLENTPRGAVFRLAHLKVTSA